MAMYRKHSSSYIMQPSYIMQEISHVKTPVSD